MSLLHDSTKEIKKYDNRYKKTKNALLKHPWPPLGVTTPVNSFQDMEEESTNKMTNRFGKRMGRTPIDNADGSKTHRYKK